MPPEKRSRPHRTLIVVVCAVLGVIAALLWALARDGYQRLLTQSAEREKLDELRRLLALRRRRS